MLRAWIFSVCVSNLVGNFSLCNILEGLKVTMDEYLDIKLTVNKFVQSKILLL